MKMIYLQAILILKEMISLQSPQYQILFLEFFFDEFSINILVGDVFIHFSFFFCLLILIQFHYLYCTGI